MFAKITAAALSTALVTTALTSSALASDEAWTSGNRPVSGTVDIQYVDGRVEQSEVLWTAKVPSRIWIAPAINKCRDLVIPLTPQVPIETLDDLDVEAELWLESRGEMTADGSIYSSEWNPSGGVTQLRVEACDLHKQVGQQTLYIITEYEVSTNGLVSQYLSGRVTLPLTVKELTVCYRGKFPPTATKDLKQLKRKSCPKGWKKMKRSQAAKIWG